MPSVSISTPTPSAIFLLFLCYVTNCVKIFCVEFYVRRPPADSQQQFC